MQYPVVQHEQGKFCECESEEVGDGKPYDGLNHGKSEISLELR